MNEYFGHHQIERAVLFLQDVYELKCLLAVFKCNSIVETVLVQRFPVWKEHRLLGGDQMKVQMVDRTEGTNTIVSNYKIPFKSV